MVFTEDVFAYYGGKKRFGEKAQVWTGRAFVVGVTLVAYFIAFYTIFAPFRYYPALGAFTLDARPFQIWM